MKPASRCCDMAITGNCGLGERGGGKSKGYLDTGNVLSDLCALQD